MLMQMRIPASAILGGVAAMSLLTGACATKKHVREAIAPVQQQVNDVQKKTQENTTSIGDLDRNIARVDEKTMEADKKAAAAGQAADRANQAANQAQQTANSATSLAQQTKTELTARAGKIEERINNLDNYKLLNTEKIYFRVNHYELTKEDKAKLDQAIQNIQNMKNYVIEVAGYTDKTGSRAANLELSRRRADAVVRYLTVDHNIPLRKIHDVGAGSDFPDADNHNRAARKENRRVDIRVYGLEGEGGPTGTGQGLSSTSTPPVSE
jgi:outer membrane protein OmpA-like peptidoglycan-associated protein